MPELELIRGSIFQGLRTPDGTMVIRRDPPTYEPISLRETNFDWGVKNRGAFELARFLLSSVGRQSIPGKGSKELLEEVVQYLSSPRFAITQQEIHEWVYGPQLPPEDNRDVLADGGL